MKTDRDLQEFVVFFALLFVASFSTTSQAQTGANAIVSLMNFL